MEDLGNLLREAREAKGMSLAEVQAVIRIQSKFLEALESGLYHELPTPAHAKGFLRNYARFLGLDPIPLLERYELVKERAPASGPGRVTAEENLDEPLPLREDQPFFDPVNVDLSGSSASSGSFPRWVIILALIIALALVANRFVPLLIGDEDENGTLADNLNEVISEIANEPEPTATIDEMALSLGTQAPITSTNRNPPILLPTPTATRPPLPATLDIIRLQLDITERTWMRVTIDGDVVFEGLARNGDEPYQWEAQQEATLLTGNAIGIFVTINEIPLGKLGGRGEVVEETWTTTE